MKFEVFVDINIAPVEFFSGERNRFLVNIFDLSLSFDVSGLLVDVIPEGGLAVPVLVFFEEILPIPDHFAVGAVDKSKITISFSSPQYSC